jgi:uncharacterized protein
MTEFLEVVSRPKFSRFTTSRDVADLLAYIGHHSEFFEVLNIDSVCRDPKDDFI